MSPVCFVQPFSFLRSSVSFQGLAEGLLEAGGFICRRITKLLCISETCWRYHPGAGVCAAAVGTQLVTMSELSPCSSGSRVRSESVKGGSKAL